MPYCKLQKATISIHDVYSICNGKTIWHKATHFDPYQLSEGHPGDVAILIKEDADEAGKILPPIAGKVYSIMALPLAPTSLPVHLNGDFRMSSDRRTLWAGEGDRGQVYFDLPHI